MYKRQGRYCKKNLQYLPVYLSRLSQCAGCKAGVLFKNLVKMKLVFEADRPPNILDRKAALHNQLDSLLDSQTIDIFGEIHAERFTKQSA